MLHAYPGYVELAGIQHSTGMRLLEDILFFGALLKYTGLLKIFL